MAAIRKRGDKWFAEVCALGQRRGKSFATRTAAKAWAEETEDEIRRGGAQDSLRAVLNRYAREVSPGKRGARWEIVRLALFERLMPFVDQPAASITPEQIGKWRDDRLATVSAGSVLRELGLLATVFETARREWRLVSINPVRDVRKPQQPRGRDVRVSDDDVSLILALAGWRPGEPATLGRQIAAAAFTFAIETAMRAGEIRALTGAHVHIDERYVHIPDSKTGVSRDVPLTTGAVKILRGLDADRPFPITAQMLDVEWRKLRDKAGLRCTFHDSRHEAITRLSRKLDVRDLARMTGHGDLKTLLRYYNPTAAELAARLG